MHRPPAEPASVSAMQPPNRRRFLSWTAFAAAHYLLASSRPTRATERLPAGPPRLRHIELETADPTKLEPFYREILELPTRLRDDGTLEVQTGESVLRFKAGDGEPFYHFAFNIPHNKLPHSLEWITQRHTLLEPSWQESPVVYFEAWDAHAIYFADPAGNILEFIAHHRLDNSRPGAFSSRDILYTSEVGIVVAEFEKALKSFGDADLEPGGPLYDGFAAIGDPHGFFILVAEDRVWLPTKDQAAMIASVQAQFRSRQDVRVDLGPLPYQLIGRPIAD